MNHSISGIIEAGAGRGRGLGFPTANIPITESIRTGVYASRIRIDGVWHHCVSFIGSAETFGEQNIRCETYIFDFDQDIYGKEVRVELVEYIRESKPFPSAEALQKAIQQDIDKARKILNT